MANQNVETRTMIVKVAAPTGDMPESVRSTPAIEASVTPKPPGKSASEPASSGAA